MPAVPSLYSLLNDEASYFSAAIVLGTNPHLGRTRPDLSALTEPSVPGYRRIEGQKIDACFDSVILSPFGMGHLTSKQIDLHNGGNVDEHITAVALVVWLDRFTPWVQIWRPCQLYWHPGTRIQGRFTIGIYVHTERG